MGLLTILRICSGVSGGRSPSAARLGGGVVGLPISMLNIGSFAAKFFTLHAPYA